MTTSLEKQLNIWAIQEELTHFDPERQLELSLKALRDQYIEKKIIESKKVKTKHQSSIEDSKVKTKHRKACLIL